MAFFASNRTTIRLTIGFWLLRSWWIWAIILLFHYNQILNTKLGWFVHSFISVILCHSLTVTSKLIGFLEAFQCPFTIITQQFYARFAIRKLMIVETLYGAGICCCWTLFKGIFYKRLWLCTIFRRFGLLIWILRLRWISTIFGHRRWIGLSWRTITLLTVEYETMLTLLAYLKTSTALLLVHGISRGANTEMYWSAFAIVHLRNFSLSIEFGTRLQTLLSI